MKILTAVGLLAMGLMVRGVPARAEKVRSMPPPTAYVDDYAGVMSEDGKKDVETLCRELHDKTKAQIFLVTVETTEGEPVEQFANELFAKWKIGEKKTDRGVLLLLAVGDHKRWIEVGYGLEAILNDARVGDIGRAMVPQLQAARYDDAAKIGVEDVAKIIAADSGVVLETPMSLTSLPQTGDDDPEPAAAAEESSGSGWQTNPTVILSVFGGILGGAALFGLFGFFRHYRRWRARPAQGTAGGSGMGTFLVSNEFLDSRGRGSDGGSSGGGGGGDSFSGGDGGSSGGGGAGGDW